MESAIPGWCGGQVQRKRSRNSGHSRALSGGPSPGQNLAFDNALAQMVVLIAGSTGSALRAVRPSNLHITPNGRRDLVHAASATGSL